MGHFIWDNIFKKTANDIDTIARYWKDSPLFKNIPDEDLSDAITNKVYDDLALDQAVAYVIDYIEVYDVIGKMVYKSNITESITNIDLTHMNTGLYYVSVNKGEERNITKIMIQ